jgi:signal transduction histidine kinase
MEQLAIKVLQRRMVVFSVLALLLTGAMVATAAIVPLASQLREAARRELVHVHTLTAQRLGQHAQTLTDLALQVTSRTRIREELETYLAGRVSASDLRAFTEPKLADAMQLSHLMIGITRRAADGAVAAVVGRPLPAGLARQPVAERPSLIGPVLADDETVLLVVAPIHDEHGTVVGSDAVLFSTGGLGPILRHQGGHHAYLRPAAQAPQGGQPWYGVSDDGLLAPAAAPIPLIGSDTLRVGASPSADGTTWITVSGLQGDTGWQVITTAPAADVFAEVRSVIVLAAVATGVAVALGALALLLLLRPLGGTLVVQAADLAGQVNRLRAMSRDLEAERHRLQASNSELEQFAYVASHDLQQPLRMISGFLDLLSRRYADHLDNQAREYIGHAVNGAHQLRAMIEGLLEYSRVGRIESGHKLTDLAMVARRAADLLTVRVGETKARISIGPLPSVPAEPQQMVRLFQNLIDNALKYRHPERPPQVDISCRPDEAHGWIVSVSDNGLGMSPEQRRQAFGLFRRLHPQVAVEGAGMGLALCQKIVNQHGGTITLDSEEGVGSTFTIHLPRPGRAAGRPSDGEGSQAVEKVDGVTAGS